VRARLPQVRQRDATSTGRGLDQLPTPGLPGLAADWSRIVTTVGSDGSRHRWHVLDNGVQPTAGTMVCVHGNPTWSYLWRRLLAVAPPGWRVVAPDHLGMGFSERGGEPRTLAQRIDDLGVLTDALGISGPVVVVAHDWGGPISLGWTLAHREQVRAIVLTNTAVHHPAGSPAPTLIRLARSTALRQATCVSSPAFVRAATALSRPPLPAEVRDAFAAPYATADRRRAVGDFVADIPLEPDHPSRAALDAIADGVTTLSDVPVLLLWGTRDPVFGEGYLRDLVARLPHAAVHRYQQASHLLMEDVPAAVGHLWSWVSELDHTPAVDDAPPAAPDTQIWAALTARSDDAAPAVVELAGSGSTVSFAALEDRIRTLAAGFAATGVASGDRVALLVPPGADLTAVVYACWRIGAVIVVADAGLGVTAMGRALRGAAPDHVVGITRGLALAAAMRVPGRRISVEPVSRVMHATLGVERGLDAIAELGRRHALPAEPAADAECAVLFTSGATGPAKGVVYRHDQVRAQLRLLTEAYRITAADRLVAAFAPFALYGPALGIGAATPDMDVTAPGTLTAAALADAAAAVDATIVFASPAALVNIVATQDGLTDAHRAALAGVRLVMSAGAPVPASLLRAVQRLTPNAELHTPYGMTEALPVADISLVGIDAAGAGNGVCVGRPLPGVDLAVSPLSPDGTVDGPLVDTPEVTGEVCVRSPHVKDRYDRLWATERDSSRNPGWHRTGDVGHLDDDGRLWIEGRLVHVVTTADGPVTPVALEQRVQGLDGVRAAAVVGVGPVGTQQVVVVVVPSVAERRWPLRGRDVLAPAGLSRAVRDRADVRIAAVLTTAALPVDIRHASKVDRARVARWAVQVLAGGRVSTP
jgi:acyl-coenzyme A synthetase/AMP-(fatty) acid ligase/pimeloyl-ACP methyl ester carboxylesterase